MTTSGRPPALDATMRAIPIADSATWARHAEELGFDGVVVTETNNDPFLPLALAATTTGRVSLGTGIALAFPRTPMEVAYTAWNLQDLTGGRFVLGLGTQVRAHVERRFGVPWSHPARRMREYVLALRAIWRSWETGEPLDFRGEFTSHTLMPPAFRPRPQPHGAPPVYLAAVRERMIEVAGEVADGLLVHPLQSPRFVDEVVRPALDRGVERAGRTGADVAISVAQFAATTPDELEAIRRRIAFYGSTPGYRQVLDLHGWSGLFEELHALSRSDGWGRMPGLVTDEQLTTFAAYGETPQALAEDLGPRTRGVDRVALTAGEGADLESWAPLVARWRAG
ncbi:TIGR03617 family F420-dependent LLM class oxidoreductase [Capillimicrobium parvum]|nr:TIGR03617 family F420-dependent LLM class oxidoreductase [Capillimicrobium parvum]